MQRGLVNHRAGKKCVAVIFQRDGQTLKPVGPLAAQMAFDPDLIDYGLIRVSFWVDFVCHFLVPFVAGYYSPFHLLNVQEIYLLYGMNV